MPRRSMKTLGTLAAAAVLTVGVGLPAAHADSGIRVVYGGGENDGASNEECAGQWLHATNQFRLQDRDLADDDWCYIDYRFEGRDNTGRYSIPQDQSSGWYYSNTIDNPGAVPRIEFKVCQERQNDPDLCLNWRTYRT
ncbi:hypothetical protein [Nocardiopsis deserti]|uniref:hypothetical protein n=1 Tax=Nocardiopsis deserti TaxID=2605988 RepID=UPI001238CAA2|nr:hypothetical protein [Nocardiopsis deserti]